MSKIKEIRAKLKKMADRKRAQALQRFFKTGKGEYGEGDIFIGIKVPDYKALAKDYKDISFSDLEKLLRSKIHEERSLALTILTGQYARADKERRKKMVDFYLKYTKFINNWDLVDMSAHHILGNWLLDKNRKLLYKLAKSKNFWEKRISIIATFAFIRNNEFEDCLRISEILLNDDNDLIHKAVGWMLREVGKKDLKTEEKFLKNHYKKMPRTMLRYAIERFEETERQAYLKGEV